MGARFRFQRYAEDADVSGAVIARRPVSGEPWHCPVCGAWDRNRLDPDRCTGCDEFRGAWPCDCGHVNGGASETCETCGRERPEEYE